jgi:hypothetical protein
MEKGDSKINRRDGKRKSESSLEECSAQKVTTTK